MTLDKLQQVAEKICKNFAGDLPYTPTMVTDVEQILRDNFDESALTKKIHHLTELLDRQNGTPCEQIRHEQEIEEVGGILINIRTLVENFHLAEDDPNWYTALANIDAYLKKHEAKPLESEKS